MRNVRVWFTKLGRARYISHLDINRCMNRAVRRAGLPLWYTEGYNPHPYMTFSLPLPLGVESLCESMDIRILDDAFTNDMVLQHLDAVMPDGLRIQSVNDSLMQAKEIAFAVYEMQLELPGDAQAAASCLKAAIESGELPAEKKSKSGRRKIIKTVNLAEYIGAWSIAEGQKQLLLTMTLAAGITKNVNPILLLDTMLTKAGVEIASKSILRKQLLTESQAQFQ